MTKTGQPSPNFGGANIGMVLAFVRPAVATLPGARGSIIDGAVDSAHGDPGAAIPRS
jgi:hypothetical protein